MHLGRNPDGAGDGVSALKGGDDAFGSGQQLEGVHRISVAIRGEIHPADMVQVGEFGSDSWVVKPRGDAVRPDDLSAFILKEEAARAVQYAGGAALHGGGMVALVAAATAGFDADERDARVVNERGKDADGVAAAVDAGNDGIGQAPARSWIWARASRPMTRWNSRTIWG